MSEKKKEKEISFDTLFGEAVGIGLINGVILGALAIWGNFIAEYGLIQSVYISISIFIFSVFIWKAHYTRRTRYLISAHYTMALSMVVLLIVGIFLTADIFLSHYASQEVKQGIIRDVLGISFFVYFFLKQAKKVKQFEKKQEESQLS